jgi:hypothetical protein
MLCEFQRVGILNTAVILELREMDRPKIPTLAKPARMGHLTTRKGSKNRAPGVSGKDLGIDEICCSPPKKPAFPKVQNCGNVCGNHFP